MDARNAGGCAGPGPFGPGMEAILANLSQEQLRRLARLGAIARLEQLRQEETAIRSEFPELFGRGRREQVTNGHATTPRRRRRRAMSPAARKAVSERMRKYWAERRKVRAK
jgi:hypothetical protein